MKVNVSDVENENKSNLRFQSLARNHRLESTNAQTDLNTCFQNNVPDHSMSNAGINAIFEHMEANQVQIQSMAITHTKSG